MLDCGLRSVSLTSEEFLKAAKQCLAVEDEALSGRGMPPDVAQALKSLSQYLFKSKAEAKAAFDRQDPRRSGRIEPRELLQLLRDVLKHPPTDLALRYVSVHLYLSFMDGDGTVSFRELVKVRGLVWEGSDGTNLVVTIKTLLFPSLFPNALGSNYPLHPSIHSGPPRSRAAYSGLQVPPWPLE